MLWSCLHTLVASYTLVLDMVGLMSQLDTILLLDKDFLRLLWISMGGVVICVSLGIGMSIMADIG